MDSHVSFLVVNSENAGKLIIAAFKGNDCAVEDGVACGKKVSRDNGVSVKAPDYILAALGLVLPGDIRKRGLVKNLYVHSIYLFRYFPGALTFCTPVVYCNFII